jgi:alanyl-tRNA synthetase
LEKIELEANRRVEHDDAPHIFTTSMEEATALGAVALFGEKYGESVRVVQIGDYSLELCGGTHVERTGRIGLIRILHESSIGSGMRRVEALVGPDAIREINADRELLRGLVDALGSKDPGAALEHARRVIEENKRLRGELGTLRAGDRASLIAGLVADATPVDGVELVVREVPGEDAGGLRELAQKTRDKFQGRPAAVVIGNADGGKAMLVAACTEPAIERGVTAPALLESAARAIGGGAGGKDALANAGGRNGDRVPEALGGIPARLGELLAAH